MMTPARMPARALAALCTVALFAAAVPRGHAEIPRSAFIDCQSAYLKTSTKLLKKRTGAILQCSARLLKCALEDELAGGDFATCSVKVAESCAKKFDKLVLSENAIGAKLSPKCAPLAEYDFGSSVGLGFRRFVSACGPVTSEAQAVACFVSRLRCRAGDIAETLQARTYELFSRAGLLAAHPETTACIDARPDSPATSGDPVALAACEKGLTKAFTKPIYKIPSVLSPCLGDLLECQLREDRLNSQVQQPPACFNTDDTQNDCGKAQDELIATSGTLILGDATSDCASLPVADILGGLGFQALCPGAATPTAVADCVRSVVLEPAFAAIDEAAPRTCALIDDAPVPLTSYGNFCAPQCGNNLLEDGETCDDGNFDNLDECTNQCETGPTTHTPVTIAATAHAPHTPDGTPANAVAPGSTLATQFGSTIFDLNNVTYVRYAAPGAGDPDAVLILIPGFAGGSHSLKVVAETMVAKAAADGAIKLEVWTFDRRTDQLEDDAGGILAETEDDPELAMNWYFGSELGLPLDPRLSRRAVFHSSSDLAFLGNFTYNMFIHDIDDVVNVAHALPSNPNVFLGGHSLGTRFTAQYAATDLDAGPGVEAGYSKVDGLVLFEGGGDSIRTTPWPDAILDTIIARYDGGLYYAIKYGNSRCYNGSACTTNADCSALPLPPGALTNVCVATTNAYAGGVISPQIHAAGDVIGPQARRHPDSLTLARKNYGSGTAISNVPGLTILGFIVPDSSAEASAAFFLDDDFSPEVSFMASIGFSDNGKNTDQGGFLVASFDITDPDPYRYWKGIDAAMPADALPDNGPVTDAYTINGQEKEITTMGNMLSMLHTGDRNIGDWYFPYSGLLLTWDGEDEFFTDGLDSTALSVTRGRPDIDNLTLGAQINIPVICFGGSNGITPTPGAFLPFAEDIATCSAPSCTGAPRIVATDPINPTYGNAEGGFEAYISEGYAHIDIVAAEDDPSHNHVYDPLLAFLKRNTN